MMGYNRVTPHLTSSMARLIVREQSDGCDSHPCKMALHGVWKRHGLRPCCWRGSGLWDRQALDMDVAPR